MTQLQLLCYWSMVLTWLVVSASLGVVLLVLREGQQRQ
jgi:hypothetical protein